MTDTLSPALTAWLARFTAEVAPQFTWKINSNGALRSITENGAECCPLVTMHFHYKHKQIRGAYGCLIDAFKGQLTDREITTIILSADHGYLALSYSPALRTALLAACGVLDVLP